MEHQDNLPIGIAQEPVEEAHHPAVRTYFFIQLHFLCTTLKRLYFIYFVLPSKIKITGEGSNVARIKTKQQYDCRNCKNK